MCTPGFVADQRSGEHVDREREDRARVCERVVAEERLGHLRRIETMLFAAERLHSEG